MASSRTFIGLVATTAALFCAGCVVVNPSNVSVGGFTAYSNGDSGPPATPYASALQKVIRQQEPVAKQVNKAKWDNAAEDINDWAQYTRKLLGYADTSRDPARFRAYGNELLAAIERLRLAVNRHDSRAAHDALNACNPILDKFSRDFPMVASPNPPPARSGAPANRSSGSVP